MPIISLQGGMAVGKTTLAKRLQNRLNNVNFSFEYQKKRPEGLNIFKESDYYKIQSYFINQEIERYKGLPTGNVIIDLGPEEIEFYTLFFPKSIGAAWNVEDALHEELMELGRCEVNGILYLDANPDILYQRRAGDLERCRGFFENYIKYLHPFKRKWFEFKEKCTIVDVGGMTADEVEEWTVCWLSEKWSFS